MRFVRYQRGRGGTPKYGWVYDDLVGEVEGDIFGEFKRLEASDPLYAVQLFAPVIPGKIIGVEWNYLDQARENERVLPEFPVVFLKSPDSIIGQGAPIVLPPTSKDVRQEAELAVVIGKRAKAILPEDAFSYVFGYTIANDITAYDFIKPDEPWTRAKSFDSFCPLGPGIVTDFEAADALLTCRVNGELRQMASTRDMVFSVSNLIAYISSIMTLNPGDVILTGSPAGAGVLNPGDSVESHIDGIGELINPVVSLNG